VGRRHRATLICCIAIGNQCFDDVVRSLVRVRT
jgi:hypothetical protein